MKTMSQHRVSHLAHDLLDELMTTTNPKGTKAMLLYEDLARERMREAERVAQELRLVRRLSSVRRWERLSAWAARRAERAAVLG
ncbi:MAG: hypothetical protein ACJ72N_25515 [Labedaea sp.]